MIREDKIFELVQVLKWFSIQFVSKTGEVIDIPKCRCTSFFSSGSTMKVKAPHWKNPITVNRKTIIEFNGQEVFL